jgi:hypothetical protein
VRHLFINPSLRIRSAGWFMWGGLGSRNYNSHGPIWGITDAGAELVEGDDFLWDTCVIMQGDSGNRGKARPWGLAFRAASRLAKVMGGKGLSCVKGKPLRHEGL